MHIFPYWSSKYTLISLWECMMNMMHIFPFWSNKYTVSFLCEIFLCTWNQNSLSMMIHILRYSFYHISHNLIDIYTKEMIWLFQSLIEMNFKLFIYEKVHTIYSSKPVVMLWIPLCFLDGFDFCIREITCLIAFTWLINQFKYIPLAFIHDILRGIPFWHFSIDTMIQILFSMY